MSHSYTKCTDCAHQAEVMEPDRFGVKHPSEEVIHCTVYQQFRALLVIRACDSFKRKKWEA